MFTKEEIKLLEMNKIIPQNCPLAQIEFFGKVCEKRKLDPFLKQIHLIERNERDPNNDGKWIKSYTIQSGLDGFRVIAQRNVKIKSWKRWIEKKNDDTYGCCEIDTEDRGKYYDEVPLSEYVQTKRDGTPTKFWKQFPQTMIKKVAEESVLRMLAPEDLSSFYGDEEMEQADVEQIEPSKQVQLEQHEEPQENLTDKYEQLFKGKTPTEIKDLYNSLPIAEKGKDKVAWKMAMFFKEQYEKEHPSEPEDDIIPQIGKITSKTKEEKLNELDSLIESKTVDNLDMRKKYINLYQAQLDKVGLAYQIGVMPF